MYSVHNGGSESPIAGVPRPPAASAMGSRNRPDNCQRSDGKRHENHQSPPLLDQTTAPQDTSSSLPPQGQDKPREKITFPPFIINFKNDHSASIKMITDELILFWKQQHEIGLRLTARFGHLKSLVIFTDDSSTFEALLSTKHWPTKLAGCDITIREQRQLPPEYSIVIQQFHRNWDEAEWLAELRARYKSLTKITRMRVKEGSPLNAVRADFSTVEESRSIISAGKIYAGSMILPVKPYRLPVRVNKCLRCLQHDHPTRTCSKPRLCPKCAQEHSLGNGCSNEAKCANCGGDHYSGNSACPIVQERRRQLLLDEKKKRAELLVRTERKQHKWGGNSDHPDPLTTNPILYDWNQPAGTNIPAAATQLSRHQLQNLDVLLSSFMEKLEHRLDQFSSRLSSQLCEIEKRIDVATDRQSELDSAVFGTVIPSIQELLQILTQQYKARTIQEKFATVAEKLNLVVHQHQSQATRRATPQTPALQPDPPAND